MLEFELILTEFMQFIFVDINSKRSPNRWEFIVTYNENLIAQTSFIFRCSFSTFQIRNLEPKSFVCFYQTINQRLDNNAFSFFLTCRNSHLRFANAANRECMGSILCTNISMSSIFSMNAFFRVEFKAIIKRHFFF